MGQGASGRKTSEPPNLLSVVAFTLPFQLSPLPRILGLRRCSRRLPVVGKQLTEPGDGVRRNAREHVLEPGKRLDAAPFAGSDEASQHSRRLAAAVAAEKCPIAAAQRDIAVRPFRSAVVNLQLAVFKKAR